MHGTYLVVGNSNLEYHHRYNQLIWLKKPLTFMKPTTVYRCLLFLMFNTASHSWWRSTRKMRYHFLSMTPFYSPSFFSAAYSNLFILSACLSVCRLTEPQRINYDIWNENSNKIRFAWEMNWIFFVCTFNWIFDSFSAIEAVWIRVYTLKFYKNWTDLKMRKPIRQHLKCQKCYPTKQSTIKFFKNIQFKLEKSTLITSQFSM